MQKKLKRSDVIARLGEIAFGRSNDAVKLAFLESDGHSGELDTLDLTMLSDIKRSTSGGVEVKLLNRFDAIKLLLETVEPENSEKSGAESFFEVFNEAVAKAKDQSDDG